MVALYSRDGNKLTDTGQKIAIEGDPATIRTADK
jgi:hypothetical protein